MEKYSKWRDPGTGIQPFLPIVPPRSVSPIFVALLGPFSLVHAIARTILLGVIALLHVILIDGLCLIFTPVPPIYRLVSSVFTALTCRLALGIMGYWWITTDIYSPKRGKNGVSQISKVSPKKGDLIITNWTSYVDVLYLAFRHNPTFLLPIFSTPSSSTAPTAKTGRHTGTGSASINLSSSSAHQDLIGYEPIPLLALLARTGSLPPTYDIPPTTKYYKTLREARRKEGRPVVVFPEATTSNGRAILKFAEGVLDGSDFSGREDGQVWIKYFRHTPPTAFASSATCPIPTPLNHLVFSLLYTPTPIPSRSLHVRTLHPSASPSSPSFLPSEILNNAPGGLDSAAKDPKAVWREAVGVVLAETGRIRRTKGMGWVEKASFLDYWGNKRR